VCVECAPISQRGSPHPLQKTGQSLAQPRRNRALPRRDALLEPDGCGVHTRGGGVRERSPFPGHTSVHIWAAVDAAGGWRGASGWQGCDAARAHKLACTC